MARSFISANMFAHSSVKTKSWCFASVLVHILLVLILLSIVISTKVGTLGNLTSLSFSSEAHKELSFVDAAGSSLDNVAFDIQPNFLESDVEQMLDKEASEQIVHTIAAETTGNSSYLNAPNVEDTLHGSTTRVVRFLLFQERGNWWSCSR